MFEVAQAPPVVRSRAHALDLSILIVTWNSGRWIDRWGDAVAGGLIAGAGVLAMASGW